MSIHVYSIQSFFFAFPPHKAIANPGHCDRNPHTLSFTRAASLNLTVNLPVFGLWEETCAGTLLTGELQPERPLALLPLAVRQQR